MRLILGVMSLLMAVGCAIRDLPIDRLPLDPPLSVKIERFWTPEDYGIFIQRVDYDCGSETSFRVIAEFSSEKLTVVGLTLMGSSGFTLSYDGEVMSYDRSLLFRRSIDPQLLLLTYFLGYSDESLLQSQADGSGLSVDRTGEEGSFRLKSGAGVLLAEVQELGSTEAGVRIRYPAMACDLRLVSLAKDS